MAETGPDERRRNERAPFYKEVEVVGAGMHRCSEISIGGIYLVTKQGFPMGTRITLRFKLYDADERPIQVQARVLYIHEGVGVGLGFVGLNSGDRARIVKFIEQG
ncbi:MAG: PilZ domain-containing protein [Nitrospirae bacterium]|nr:PilZ domain-containing protein [Nitrospirota bacterium]